MNLKDDLQDGVGQWASSELQILGRVLKGKACDFHRHVLRWFN